MNYEDARVEHIVGKTIAEATITDSNVEIKFTDGTELTVDLTFYGYGGARLDNTFWPE